MADGEQVGAITNRPQIRQETVGGQCRERCFSVSHAPQAHHSLRLASLDTSLEEGGYSCTAGCTVHSVGKRAAYCRDGAPGRRSLRCDTVGIRLPPVCVGHGYIRAARVGKHVCLPYGAMSSNSRSTGALRLSCARGGADEGGGGVVSRHTAASVSRRWYAVAAGVRRARIHPCRPRGERGVSPRRQACMLALRCVAVHLQWPTASRSGRLPTARKFIGKPPAGSVGNAVSAFRMRRRRITPSVSLRSTPPSEREAVFAPPVPLCIPQATARLLPRRQAFMLALPCDAVGMW